MPEPQPAPTAPLRRSSPLAIAGLAVAAAVGFVWLVAGNQAVFRCLRWGCECWLALTLLGPALLAIGATWVEMARQGFALPRLRLAAEVALVVALAALPVAVGVAASQKLIGVVEPSAWSITDHALALTIGGAGALAVVVGRVARRG